MSPAILAMRHGERQSFGRRTIHRLVEPEAIVTIFHDHHWNLQLDRRTAQVTTNRIAVWDQATHGRDSFRTPSHLHIQGAASNTKAARRALETGSNSGPMGHCSPARAGSTLRAPSTHRTAFAFPSSSECDSRPRRQLVRNIERPSRIGSKADAAA